MVGLFTCYSCFFFKSFSFQFPIRRLFTRPAASSPFQGAVTEEKIENESAELDTRIPSISWYYSYLNRATTQKKKGRENWEWIRHVVLETNQDQRKRRRRRSGFRLCLKMDAHPFWLLRQVVLVGGREAIDRRCVSSVLFQCQCEWNEQKEAL